MKKIEQLKKHILLKLLKVQGHLKKWEVFLSKRQLLKIIAQVTSKFLKQRQKLLVLDWMILTTIWRLNPIWNLPLSILFDIEKILLQNICSQMPPGFVKFFWFVDTFREYLNFVKYRCCFFSCDFWRKLLSIFVEQCDSAKQIRLKIMIKRFKKFPWKKL